MTQLVFGQPEGERLMLSNNGDATVLAINPIGYMLPYFFEPAILDIREFEGTIRPLAPVMLDENF